MGSRSLFLILANLVLVPAGTIAMVYAFLAYLIHIAMWPMAETASLKWIGFWFVVATVLIARFGQMHRSRARRHLYTLFLAGATFLAMARLGTDVWDWLLYAVVVGLVWEYATGLVDGLSLERLPEKKETVRRYGLERIQFEKDLQLEKKEEEVKVKKQIHPTRSVVRLTLIALLLFALGEPILFNAPQETRTAALMYTILFLFSSAWVLAAAHSIEVMERIHKTEGVMAPGILPIRLLASSLVMIVILGLCLAVSGLDEGWEQGAGNRWQQESNSEAGKGSREEGSGEGEGTVASESSASGESRPESRSSTEAWSWLPLLHMLGKVLLWVAVVLFILILGWFIWYLLSHLAQVRKKIPQLVLSLKGLFRRFLPLYTPREKALGLRQPMLGREDFANMSPRETILAGYQQMLLFCAAHGFDRQEGFTPDEFLRRLPVQWESLKPAMAQVTKLYYRAAYGQEQMSEGDRGPVMDCLEQMAAWRPITARPPG